MRFPPPKYNVILRDYVGSKLMVLLSGETIEVFDHFYCLGRLNSVTFLVKDEVIVYCQARVAFTNLRHLLRFILSAHLSKLYYAM